LGVDYRDTNIEQPGYYFGGAAPLVAGEYTQLQIMKFAPAIAFQASQKVSLGLALHVDYASLDLRDGNSFNYGFGAQAGLIYRPVDNLSVGLTYVSPQTVDHENVVDFDGDGDMDKLEMEAPQQAGFGIAYQGGPLLVEADARWMNWAGAKGYEDFDWDDQWVFGIGAQLEAATNLFLRAGFSYGENPVNEHNGFDGSFSPTTGFPNSIVNVQGKTLPTYYYETFRIIGFPAVVESHVTLGIGYQFSPKFSMDLGYVHAFEKTIAETGMDPYGMPVTLESTLSEDSLDFGLTWRF
jgi:long-chain fatty acid transport protein